MPVTSNKTARQVRHLGGGFNTDTGSASQGKESVVGVLEGTYDTGGVAVSPKVFGLTKIDYVEFRVTTPAPGTGGSRVASTDGSLLFLHDPDGETQEGNNTAFVIEFLAEGEGARNVELLA